MIPNTKLATHQGSLGGEVTAMGMDATAIVHLMSVLTNLYSNSELAVLREYSTNALDSHIFDGQTRPIEIRLPNSMDRRLIIRDFGLGMDKDEIQNTYANYGTSTKRENNDSTGCLGIGSKSALAYTNTFTVTSVKDGMKYVVVIYLGTNGAGQVEIVSETETEESNGVEVAIPSKGQYDFEDEATEFFKYWDKGLVLVNDKEPVHYTDDPDMTEISEDLWVSSNVNRYNSSVTFVMGNIPYTYSGSELTNNLKLNSGVKIVAKVDIGAVDFVPSREALNLTDGTKDTIKITAKYVADSLVKSYTEQFHNAETLAEAVEMANKLSRVKYTGSLKWNGLAIRMSQGVNGYLYTKFHKCESINSVNTVDMYRGDNIIIMGKSNLTRLSSVQREKLETYCVQNEIDTRRFFYMNIVPAVLADVPTLEWNDINSIVLPRAARRASAPRVKAEDREWEYYYDNSGCVSSTTGKLDTTMSIVYESASDLRSGLNYRGRIAIRLGNVQVVKLPANLAKAFHKAYPDAMTVFEFLNSEAKKATLSSDEIAAHSMRYESKVLIRSLTGKTKDAKIDAIGKIDASRVESILTLWNVTHTQTNIPTASEGISRYMENTYPLASTSQLDHTIRYIDGIYEGTI